jgi:hypothetical protein
MVTKKMSDVRGKMQHGKLPTANWRLHAGGVAALVCIGLMALAGLVQAQPAPGSQVPGSKYYVWGQVRNPGAYSFIASPDIVELLSAGGGPTQDANLRQVVLIRAVTQKRMRIDLQKMMSSGQVLRLAPGDVVIVSSSAWYSFRDGLAVATTLVSAVTLVITILSWTSRP